MSFRFLSVKMSNPAGWLSPQSVKSWGEKLNPFTFLFVKRGNTSREAMDYG